MKNITPVENKDREIFMDVLQLLFHLAAILPRKRISGPMRRVLK